MDRASRERLQRLLPRKFVCIDIGARGGLDFPWKGLKDCVRGVFFEPDPDEFARLSARGGDTVVLPHAVSRQAGAQTLHLTKARRCSSLLRPNMALLGHFPESDRFTVETSAPVQTVTIDALHREGALPEGDFIKIDTQGAERDILVGGQAFVREHVLGLQVEVAFRPLYEGQPLFHELDNYIREEFGLELVDISMNYWKYTAGIGLGPKKGQLVVGDALYFPHPEQVVARCARLDPDKAAEKTAMACVMALAYGYVDYAMLLLELEKPQAILAPQLREGLLAVCARHGRCLTLDFPGTAILDQGLRMLLGACRVAYHGWGTASSGLGSRKKFGFFY